MQYAVFIFLVFLVEYKRQFNCRVVFSFLSSWSSTNVNLNAAFPVSVAELSFLSFLPLVLQVEYKLQLSAPCFLFGCRVVFSFFSLAILLVEYKRQLKCRVSFSVAPRLSQPAENASMLRASQLVQSQCPANMSRVC